MQGDLLGRVRPRYLHFQVTRENLLTTAMSEISKISAEDLKLPLVVHFTSNAVAEEGVDQGGVAKVGFT